MHEVCSVAVTRSPGSAMGLGVVPLDGLKP